MRYSKAKLRFLSLMLSAVLCIGSAVYAFAEETETDPVSAYEEEISAETGEEPEAAAYQEDEEAEDASEASSEDADPAAAGEETDKDADEEDAAAADPDKAEDSSSAEDQDTAVVSEDETAEDEVSAEEVASADEDAAEAADSEEKSGDDNEEDPVSEIPEVTEEQDDKKSGSSENDAQEEAKEDQHQDTEEDPVPDTEEENTSEKEDDAAAEEPETAEKAETDKKDEAAEEDKTASDEKPAKTTEEEEAADAGVKEASGVLKTAVSEDTGKYFVKIRQFSAPSDIIGLKALLWPEKSPSDTPKELFLSAEGTDTAVWSASSYIKDFSCYGNISVKVYLVDKKGGEKLFKEGSFSISSPKAASVRAAVNKKTGDFQVNVSGVVSQFTVGKVEVNVVSMSDSSQSAVYTANVSKGRYIARGNVSDLGSRTGKYKASAYVTPKNGIRKFVGSVKFDYSESAGTIKYKDKFAGKTGKEQRYYKLSLSGAVVDHGIGSVQFEVWNKSFPEITKEYAAESVTSGIYTALVPIKDFRTKGTYAARAYVTDGQGNRKMLISSETWTVDGEASGKISITKTYNNNGAFRAQLNASAPAGISSVKFAVWVKADKSDLVYYTAAKTAEGKFAAKIKAFKHGQHLGNYKIKAIVKMYNGTKSRKISRTYYFTPENYTYCVTPELGTRTIYLCNTAISSVQFYVWSDTNGQDDMVIYEATRSGLKWKVDIPLSNHSGAGVYNVHMYSGSTYLTGISFDVIPNEAKTGWYYENGYKFYYNMGERLNDVRSLVSGPYEIWINRQMNTITIYASDGGNGFIIPVVAFVCSCGLPGMETPLGWYTAGYQSRWEELMGPSWGQYTTHVVDGIYIHSVAGYNMTPYNLDPYDYNNLGNFASHGCIRVNVASAKWIYDNCPPGTWINIYDSDWPGPLGKPESIKIPPYQNWDPTDPNI